MTCLILLLLKHHQVQDHTSPILDYLDSGWQRKLHWWDPVRWPLCRSRLLLGICELQIDQKLRIATYHGVWPIVHLRDLMYSGTCLMWSPMGPRVQWNLSNVVTYGTSCTVEPV